MDENVPSGTWLASYPAFDPDVGDVGKLVYTWTNPVNDAFGVPAFYVFPNNGTLMTMGQIDYEFLTTYTVRLLVTDSGNLKDNATIVVNVHNLNEPPVVFANQAYVGVENSPRGTVIGTIHGSDPDAGTVLTWSIRSGNDNGSFALDPATGVLSLAFNEALDYERQTVYTVLIDVKDNGVSDDPTPLLTTGSIFVSVTNVNDVLVTKFSVLFGSNLGRINPIGTDWGPLAQVSFGGPTGQMYQLHTLPDGSDTSVIVPGTCSRQNSTAIFCSVGPGAGVNHIWRVADGPDVFVSAPPLTLSFDVPIITGCSGAEQMPTSGGSQVVLTGKNFGPMGTLVSVRYGPVRAPYRYTAVSCSVTVADSQITCIRYGMA